MGIRIHFLIIIFVYSILIATFSIYIRPQDAFAVGVWNGPTSVNLGEMLVVPVSWCYTQDSPTDQGFPVPNNVIPGAQDDTTPEQKLWRRHERISEELFINEIGITFRSGVGNPVMQSFVFPEIADRPRQTDGFRNSGTEWRYEATNILGECRERWGTMLYQHGKQVGIPVVNVDYFIDGNNNIATSDNGELFIGMGACTKPKNNLICNDPNDGFAMVMDNAYTFFGRAFMIFPFDDPWDWNLAHNMAAALGLHPSPSQIPQALRHPTPQDINGDGYVDNFQVGPSDADAMRSSALRVNDMVRDPPNMIIPGDITASHRIDENNRNETVSYRNLDSVRVSLDQRNNSATFSNYLAGLIPKNNNNITTFWTLVDLDNNTNTGINTTNIIMPQTNFKGADLVVEAILRDQNVTGRAWIMNNTIVSPLPSSALRFDVSEMALYRTYANLINTSIVGPTPFHDIINTHIDNQQIGIVELDKPFRLQSLVIGEEKIRDRLDHNISEDGKIFELASTTFPQCFPEDNVVPGDNVTVSFNGLLPNSNIHGLIGSIGDITFTGQTNTTGGGKIEFVVPQDITPGLHLITVGIDNTALTADCVLNVLGWNHPLYGEWDIHANGFTGTLNITSISSESIGGTLKMANETEHVINGIWDDLNKKFTFLRIVSDDNSIANQLFTGYTFKDNSFGYGSSGVPDVIAGSFEAFPSSSSRTQYGWYATK